MRTRLIFLVIGLLVAVSAVGCSRARVPVTLIRPAELELTGKPRVALGEFRGREGRAVSGRLRTLLGQSGFVSLVDDPGAAAEEGRVLRVHGEDLEFRYSERRDDRIVSCRRRLFRFPDDVDEDDTCVLFRNVGTAVVSGRFVVTDAATGAVLTSKSTHCEIQETASAVEAPPGHPDRRLMLDKCARKVAAEIYKMVSPWTETRPVVFRRHRSLPTLDDGIRWARDGRWAEAAGVFEEAVRIIETDPAPNPKAAAAAHWDLGLAYQFSGRFDEALREINRAYALTGDPEYVKERQNVEQRRRESERLIRRFGRIPGPVY